MYHSVTFGSMNSFSDWHLVPESRPVISMPEVKTNVVDIPGRNGVLDLTEAITHYPVFNNRTGSLTFHVLNDYLDWAEIHKAIADYLHGKTLKMWLEDDPNWYYNGRFALEEWTSNNDGTWSDVEIAYDLEPYKLWNNTVLTDAWLWDPFSFISGQIIGSRFKDISVTSTGYVTLDMSRFIGNMPITPKVIVNSSTGIDFHFYNQELGLSVYKTKVLTGTYEWPEVILTEFNEGNSVYIQYKRSVSGSDTTSFNIDYRRGSL